MVPPITVRPILATIPARALPQLKGISSIDSFAFGRETLKPVMIELFKKQGIEIGEIHLDNPAKARLMGMLPSFKEMAAQGKTAEEIFSYLALSFFISGDENQPRTLHILADKGNLKSFSLPENFNDWVTPPQSFVDLSSRLQQINDRYADIKKKNETAPLSPEIRQERTNKLMGMGMVGVGSCYEGRSDRPIPEWLFNEWIVNFDLLIDAAKTVGDTNLINLIYLLIIKDSFNLMKKLGAPPFIEMTRYFNYNKDFHDKDDFEDWININCPAIEKHGIAPYFYVAENGGKPDALIGMGYLQKFFDSPAELAALGIFLSKALPDMPEKKWRTTGSYPPMAFLSLFSPSSNQKEVIFQELALFIQSYERIYDALKDSIRHSEFRTYLLAENGGKPIIKKLGIEAFEEAVLELKSLPRLFSGQMRNSDILPFILILGKLNPASNEELISALERIKEAVVNWKGSMSISTLSQNLIGLVKEPSLPFPLACKIAGLNCTSTDYKNCIKPYLPHLGSDFFDRLISALPSPARSGTLEAIRDCALAIKTPADIETFAEMVKGDGPMTLAEFLKLKETR